MHQKCLFQDSSLLLTCMYLCTCVCRSIFCADDIICKMHPRFPTLTRNMRERRGRKVIISIPIYVDSKTKRPFTEPLEDEEKEKATPDHIYMDAMGFGMGCPNLQATMQLRDITQALHVYDQLAPLTPIFTALSAASPIYRGYLADIDNRYPSTSPTGSRSLCSVEITTRSCCFHPRVSLTGRQ